MTAQIETLQEAIATLVRMLKIVEPEIETAHGQVKLAATDIHTMRFVAANPGCASVNIAEFLGVGPTTMSSVLKRLEGRGFLSRNRTESNRRILSVELTAEGQAVFRTIIAEERKMSATMLTSLPEARRSGFVEDMATIARNLENAATDTSGKSQTRP